MYRIWLYLVLFSTLTFAEKSYSYSYVPKSVFENQLFSITVRETHSDPSSPPEFYFTDSDTKPLVEDPSIVRNGDNSFYTFYFQAKRAAIDIPTLTITNQGKSTPLFSQKVVVKPLGEAPLGYIGVLASNIQLKSYQTAHYDEHNFIVILQLETMEANLDALHFKGYDHSTVELIEERGAFKIGEVSIVVPSKQSSFKFSYYNTVKHQFVPLTIPVEIAKSALISSEALNPKTDSFLVLKRYTLTFLVLFFFLMFVWKRDFLYLILFLILSVVLYNLFIPHKEVCIKEGTPLYLLPTKGSTVGIYVEEQVSTMSLATRNEYIKVEYLPGVIGWIKDEDTCNP
jgi:hypothetical protein